MEDASALDNQSDEQICDSFVCCVCQDLLYKPIVLACGHVSCFWCVHRCMNGVRESHCPVCRHTYHHFPNICQMLHFLLSKIYPITYKRREVQTLEYEIARDCFSPELKDPVRALQPSHNKSDQQSHLADAGQSFPTNTKEYSSSNGYSIGGGHAAMNLEKLEFSPSHEGVCENQRKENSLGGVEVKHNHGVEENVTSNGDSATHLQVLINDMLCVACSDLLFRPVVLNCGHVYCETCISIRPDEKLRCQVCQSLHPNGIPKVCLELHHFLETHFPARYEHRRNTIKQVDSQLKIATINEDFMAADDLVNPTPSPPHGDTVPRAYHDWVLNEYAREEETLRRMLEMERETHDGHPAGMGYLTPSEARTQMLRVELVAQKTLDELPSVDGLVSGASAERIIVEAIDLCRDIARLVRPDP